MLQEAEDQKKRKQADDDDEATDEEEDSDARIKNISKALAPILIPMIDGLGGIDADVLSDELDEAA